MKPDKILFPTVLAVNIHYILWRTFPPAFCEVMVKGRTYRYPVWR